MRYKDIFKKTRKVVLQKHDQIIVEHRLLVEKIDEHEYSLTGRYFADMFKINHVNISSEFQNAPPFKLGCDFDAFVTGNTLNVYIKEETLETIYNKTPTLHDPQVMSPKAKEMARRAFIVRGDEHDDIVREFEGMYGITNHFLSGFSGDFKNLNPNYDCWWYPTWGTVERTERPQQFQILLKYKEN